MATCGRGEESIDEAAETAISATITPVLSTAQPVSVLESIQQGPTSFDTAIDSNGDDLSSVTSKRSLDAVTGLPSRAQPVVPLPTAATVGHRLQEAVDDFQMAWQVSRLDDGNEISPAQYLDLLRAMLVVCGNVTQLELPKAWSKVIHGRHFPELEECIAVRHD